MRGVTVSSVFNVPELIFQLTRLMRGVTLLVNAECALVIISTHTPHARRD